MTPQAAPRAPAILRGHASVLVVSDGTTGGGACGPNDGPRRAVVQVQLRAVHHRSPGAATTGWPPARRSWSGSPEPASSLPDEQRGAVEPQRPDRRERWVRPDGTVTAGVSAAHRSVRHGDADPGGASNGHSVMPSNQKWPRTRIGRRGRLEAHRDWRRFRLTCQNFQKLLPPGSPGGPSAGRSSRFFSGLPAAGASRPTPNRRRACLLAASCPSGSRPHLLVWPVDHALQSLGPSLARMLRPLRLQLRADLPSTTDWLRARGRAKSAPWPAHSFSLRYTA